MVTAPVTEADRIRIIRQVLASPLNHGLSPADMARLIVQADPATAEAAQLRDALKERDAEIAWLRGINLALSRGYELMHGRLRLIAALDGAPRAANGFSDLLQRKAREVANRITAVSKVEPDSNPSNNRESLWANSQGAQDRRPPCATPSEN